MATCIFLKKIIFCINFFIKKPILSNVYHRDHFEEKIYVTFKYINVYCSLFWLEYHAMFGRLGQFVKVPSIHYIY